MKLVGRNLICMFFIRVVPIKKQIEYSSLKVIHCARDPMSILTFNRNSNNKNQQLLIQYKFIEKHRNVNYCVVFLNNINEINKKNRNRM